MFHRRYLSDVSRIAKTINQARIHNKKTLVVGIDGPDCSGKTTISKEFLTGAHGEGRIISTDSFVSLTDSQILQLDCPSKFVDAFNFVALQKKKFSFGH